MSSKTIERQEWALSESGHLTQVVVSRVLTVKPLEPKPPKQQRKRGRTHGLAATYNAGKCRCELCAEAIRAYDRSMRERKNELRRGKPRKPLTPEQRERKNAQVRAKRAKGQVNGER